MSKLANTNSADSQVGTIFFDFDGTVHDTLRVYAPAFRAAYAWLVEEGWAEPAEFEDEWIGRWLGWTIRDMWTAFMPGLPEEVWRRASKIIGTTMTELSEAGEGRLYPGVAETMDALKARGWTMVMLSNCQKSYRDNHRRYFGLDRWFDAYVVAEDYPDTPKWQIYQLIAGGADALFSESNAMGAADFPAPHIVVGDRFHDILVGVNGGIASIGCAFGCGEASELDSATVVVSDFRQIEEAVEAFAL